MGRILPVFAVIVLYVYVLVELGRSRSADVRALPKWLWLIVVLVIPLVGPVLWLVFGRPRAELPPSGGDGGGSIGRRPGPSGPVAPDDDPEFLKRLEEQSWASKMERLRREREGGGGQPPSSGEGRGVGEQGEPGEARRSGESGGSGEADHSGA